MIKVMLLLHRRSDVSPETFRQHWYGEHRALVERLPGLRKLVFNEVLPAPDGAPSACDGIAEDWFDTLEAMQAAMASPEGQAVAADSAAFLDLARLQVVVVAETEVPLAV
jgi:uncharacterized protein (TIGR02118 family)